MNCNITAFQWLIDLCKIQTDFRDELDINVAKIGMNEKKKLISEKFSLLNDTNCLNKLVTSHFLHLKWIYERIWTSYFA